MPADELDNAAFDYVIVGAGPAGCVLANRLSADPGTTVLLLEAGGPDTAREIRIPAAFSKLFATPYDWNYRTVKQPRLAGRELFWPRGETLGGSTSINAQMWIRGCAADYDGWGVEGWSYADVLPYFQRVERRGVARQRRALPVRPDRDAVVERRRGGRVHRPGPRHPAGDRADLRAGAVRPARDGAAARARADHRRGAAAAAQPRHGRHRRADGRHATGDRAGLPR